MNLETMMEQLAANTNAFMTETILHTQSFISEVKTNFINQAVSIHKLKVQVGQIASLLSVSTQGSLLSNTEKNPKEQVHAITLRSGKQLEHTQKPSAEIVH